MDKTIPAGQFKQQCLALLDEVARTHRGLVITKRGRPVARLMPVADDDDIEAEVLGRLRGTARMRVPEEEFLQPTADLAGWDLDRDED